MPRNERRVWRDNHLCLSAFMDTHTVCCSVVTRTCMESNYKKQSGHEFPRLQYLGASAEDKQQVFLNAFILVMGFFFSSSMQSLGQY